ncbi:MAG TPA: ATP-binding protein, partial [Cyclobacteriaceae bacterium]|nr:ATP-binding protein [Cyclobacteriaceae bacterium]
KYFSSILHNLISNALKYRSPDRKSEISITTTRIKDTVLLSVKDNGLGIDTVKHKDNLFKIRKVFHRHPDAKGFGLFITKTQVEARGGEIWVESEPGQGSTFFIKFKKQRIDPNKEPSSG